jgi:integration host factor subunit beta
MTKSELIEKIASVQHQLSAKDVELAVKMMLDQMAAALAGGDRIEIRGFGSFCLHYRPPRLGRNPKTGEKVERANTCPISSPVKSLKIASTLVSNERAR